MRRAYTLPSGNASICQVAVAVSPAGMLKRPSTSMVVSMMSGRYSSPAAKTSAHAGSSHSSGGTRPLRWKVTSSSTRPSRSGSLSVSDHTAPSAPSGTSMSKRRS